MSKNATPGLGPVPVPPRKPYIPILSLAERRAYQIAHRLVNEYFIRPVQGQAVKGGREGGELACPGARRSRLVDGVAGVIMEEMGK